MCVAFRSRSQHPPPPLPARFVHTVTDRQLRKTDDRPTDSRQTDRQTDSLIMRQTDADRQRHANRHILDRFR